MLIHDVRAVCVFYSSFLCVRRPQSVNNVLFFAMKSVREQCKFLILWHFILIKVLGAVHYPFVVQQV